jgi:hypothetical protein
VPKDTEASTDAFLIFPSAAIDSKINKNVLLFSAGDEDETTYKYEPKKLSGSLPKEFTAVFNHTETVRKSKLATAQVEARRASDAQRSTSDSAAAASASPRPQVMSDSSASTTTTSTYQRSSASVNEASAPGSATVPSAPSSSIFPATTEPVETENPAYEPLPVIEELGTLAVENLLYRQQEMRLDVFEEFRNFSAPSVSSMAHAQLSSQMALFVNSNCKNGSNVQLFLDKAENRKEFWIMELMVLVENPKHLEHALTRFCLSRVPEKFKAEVDSKLQATEFFKRRETNQHFLDLHIPPGFKLPVEFFSYVILDLISWQFY